MLNRPHKWLISLGGFAITLYSVIVLVFVAISPDVRLRFLLADEEQVKVGQEPNGIIIRSVPQIGADGDETQVWCKGVAPVENDILLKFHDQPIRSYLDFACELIALRNAEATYPLERDADPTELDSAFGVGALPMEPDGTQWVKIEFLKSGNPNGEPLKSWIKVQTVPWQELMLTIVWFVLQVLITTVGMVAYWNRPFDRSARLFLVMCLFTLGAFVGGFHWWLIAGSFFLTLPFLICAVLVPVVTLHFFLVYPQVRQPLQTWPQFSKIVIYAIPLLYLIGTSGLLSYIHWAHWQTGADPFLNIEQSLGLIRQGVYAYLTLAGVYFVLTLITLISSFRQSYGLLEQNQIKLILSGGLIAAIPIFYSLYLAHADRVAFALGKARLPMFLASLPFMLAYTVGMLRYKLLLFDQIISKGMRYYIVSVILTVGIATAFATAIVMPAYLSISMTIMQLAFVFPVIIMAIILMIWLRDHLQQSIDRRFYREKYQLDKALERMNQAVGHFVDSNELAEMLIGSCRDVLRVDQAAMYLKLNDKSAFRLSAVSGIDAAPKELIENNDLVKSLSAEGTIQRTTPDSRREMSSVQQQLREWDITLAHKLEFDGVLSGIVLLGKKRNGAAFTAEDMTFLNALGQVTNIALHSTRVRQDLARLNEELQHKTEAITVQQHQIALLESELTGSVDKQPAVAHAETAEPVFKRDIIIGNSPAMTKLLTTVRKVASTESSVLLRGESGTGKELLAQVLHQNSSRYNGPLVAVHCASLSPGLLESELFGHVKGAFTNAHRDRIGRFEAANGGTLFLDEIGDVPLEIQIKLLRVLQERTFEPVGGSRTIRVDVRLVTATHQNLEKLIEQGKFREDLFYRLNVISLTLPSLRDRQEDILDLAIYFVKRSAKRLGKTVRQFDQQALHVLQNYSWPGNIRQLENVIERAVVLAEDDRVTSRDLPADILSEVEYNDFAEYSFEESANIEFDSHVQQSRWNEKQPATHAGPNQPAQRHPDERAMLARMLIECDGNKAEAARRLKMPRSTYYSKLKKYGIT